MSRGVTPRALRDAATFSTVGNSGNGTMAALLSVTLVSVRGVTTVMPCLENGFGWDTSRVEAMLMVRLPCETAQLEILIRALATIVPVRSLIIMRAGESGVTSKASTREMKSTGAPSKKSGMRTRTMVASSARLLLVYFSLMALARRAAE